MIKLYKYYMQVSIYILATYYVGCLYILYFHTGCPFFVVTRFL